MNSARSFLPERLAGGGRAWGFSLNLYALRSRRNWGIGDFSDLERFVEIAGRLGASYVGINPLHALQTLEPRAASPYGPGSRFFLNPLYIDIEAVPEFERSAGRRSARERGERREALAALRATPLIDYAGVAAQKQTALRELYRAFRKAGAERRASFRAFVEREGERLARFAQYQALDEHLTAGAAGHGWYVWPPEYRDMETPPSRVSRETNSSRSIFTATCSSSPTSSSARRPRRPRGSASACTAIWRSVSTRAVPTCGRIARPTS